MSHPRRHKMSSPWPDCSGFAENTVPGTAGSGSSDGTDFSDMRELGYFLDKTNSRILKMGNPEKNGRIKQ